MSGLGQTQHIRDARAMSVSLPTPDVLLSRNKQFRARLRHTVRPSSSYQASQPRSPVGLVAGAERLLRPPDMKVPMRLPFVTGK